ncbi:MAG TPA: hypothetical protein EYP04_03930 [Anaerolineae bacterium]|nr:hypothetical protein [Anaerolineae bacterium]
MVHALPDSNPPSRISSTQPPDGVEVTVGVGDGVEVAVGEGVGVAVGSATVGVDVGVSQVQADSFNKIGR